MAVRVERRLVAILAADIVGYSRLTEQDEAGTLASVRGLWKRVIDPLLAEHRGRVVKLMGDGVIAEFSSVVDAVACAVAIQKAVAADQVGLAIDRRFVFRMGVNLGDVVVDGDDLLGDGVNIAARLEQLCEPGGVLVSGTAFDQLQGKLNMPLDFTGEQMVKNISRPVRVYRVRLNGIAPARRWTLARRDIINAVAMVLLLAAAVGTTSWLRATPDADRQLSIAVLPFDNLSGDERTGRLADGITEDIITGLARFRYLVVIARNSVDAYRNAVDVRQVGRELGVRYVLKGSLQTEPGKVRISVQLIDAASGFNIWTERYDRPQDDLFQARDDVTAQIAATLTSVAGPLTAAEQEVARRRPPASLQAYDYLLLGIKAYETRTKEGTAEAGMLWNKAAELDPAYARAWMSIAWARFDEALYGYSADQLASWNAFHAAARKAVDSDPLDGASYLVLGMSHFIKGETALGEAAWDRALALSPNDTLVIRPIGTQMPIALGVERAHQGVELAKRALRLNPVHPAFWAEGVGIPLYYAGRYAAAAAEFEKVPDRGLEPTIYLAMSYAQAGNRAKAAEAKARIAAGPCFHRRAMGRSRPLRAGQQLGQAVC